MISPSQRPLPDNTQHSQQTDTNRTPLYDWSVRHRDLYLTTHNTHNIHAPGGIRTRNLSRRAAAELRLRPRGHWDRLLLFLVKENVWLFGTLRSYQRLRVRFCAKWTNKGLSMSKLLQLDNPSQCYLFGLRFLIGFCPSITAEESVVHIHTSCNFVVSARWLSSSEGHHHINDVICKEITIEFWAIHCKQ